MRPLNNNQEAEELDADWLISLPQASKQQQESKASNRKMRVFAVKIAERAAKPGFLALFSQV